MLNSLTTIVRSNQNATMIRVGTGSSAIYTIYDLKTQSNTYTGTLNATKKAWNKHYRNSRQFVTKSGANHRYLGAWRPGLDRASINRLIGSERPQGKLALGRSIQESERARVSSRTLRDHTILVKVDTHRCSYLKKSGVDVT